MDDNSDSLKKWGGARKGSGRKDPRVFTERLVVLLEPHMKEQIKEFSITQAQIRAALAGLIKIEKKGRQ
jgi:hypothetical protein